MKMRLLRLLPRWAFMFSFVQWFFGLTIEEARTETRLWYNPHPLDK